MIQNLLIDKIESLDFEALDIGDSILLVTGRESFSKCGAEEILRIKLGNRKIKRFYDFEVNPKVNDVKKGLSLLEKTEAETIISVGGGSAIDMGKLLKGLSLCEGSLSDFIQGKKALPVNHSLNHIAIPTTSGSGSESTQFAVVYMDGKKYSLSHTSLLPQTAILDSDLTMSMSPYQTACSGFDALGQAVESFWSVNSTEATRVLSRKALEIIIKNLQSSVIKPNQVNRKAMQTGANLAGQAINITKTTAPHAFSYFLTSKFQIPHGHAVALLLGKFIIYNNRIDEKSNLDKGKSYDHYKRIIEEIASIICGNAEPEEADKVLSGLMEKCGLVRNINILIDLEKHYDSLFSSVNIERLNNNPRFVEKEELYSLLKNQ